MGRLHEKNRRFRSRKEMAEDVSFALWSFKAGWLTYGGQFDVLRGAMSAWTEFEGKILGCRFWSRAAIDLYRGELSTVNLRHEHVVPKNCVMALLRSLKKPAPDRVRKILKDYLIGAVVTKEQDQHLTRKKLGAKMPAGFETHPNGAWLRYVTCGIEWVDLDALPKDHQDYRLTERHRHLGES